MDLQIYIWGASALIILVLFSWVIYLQNKLGKLLVGKSKNLDESMNTLTKEIVSLNKFKTDSMENFTKIDNRLKKAVSGVETIRFNPFKGTGSGGNQSFATALLNEEKNGVIISSMYARDHISIFSKPIKNMSSEYELTAEEKEALHKAKESLTKIS
jgi:formyltetrahydrofolate synthetase